ncbi:MAG: hypothetical protein K0U52_09875 [Gammaproteobacteria bacterium]|nr:hypothetical protein [Gammaproteobacteria bacterium]
MLSQEQIKQIKLNKQIESIKQREERYYYYGLLEQYQLYPEKFNELSYRKLNPQQHFLFKRVLHGLNVYTPEEVKKLHWDKRKRITKVWKRAQREINAWKQIITNKRINAYLRKTFRGDSVNALLNVPDTEIMDDYTNKLSLKDLGITYEDLILFFLSKGLLPKNYLSIKTN